tara:strand:- start:617 stop:733 length:117 start_codon:yes stop_codon:yes gene_type:complete
LIGTAVAPSKDQPEGAEKQGGEQDNPAAADGGGDGAGE